MPWAVGSLEPHAAFLRAASQNALHRQHTSASVSIRQRTSAYVSIRFSQSSLPKRAAPSADVSIRQLTSASVSVRQHTLFSERPPNTRCTSAFCVSICNFVPVKQVN